MAWIIFPDLSNIECIVRSFFFITCNKKTWQLNWKPQLRIRSFQAFMFPKLDLFASFDIEGFNFRKSNYLHVFFAEKAIWNVIGFQYYFSIFTSDFAKWKSRVIWKKLSSSALFWHRWHKTPQWRCKSTKQWTYLNWKSLSWKCHLNSLFKNSVSRSWSWKTSIKASVVASLTWK